MSSLVIIGARAMARETCSYAIDCGMTVKGFLDSASDVLDGFAGYPSVLGPVETYAPSPDDVFVCALGNPQQKMRYVDLVKSRGGVFTNVIHPAAYVGRDARIGVGCIICPHATVTSDVTIGDHVIVNVNSSISHDVRCGNGVTISPGCNIAGRCSLGDRVFLGVGVTLIPDVSLGTEVYVAAGACVTRSFPSGRVMGVPAKIK